MKKFCLLLSILLICTCFSSVFESAQAQPKPSVPEFSVKLVDNSYDVPPTQTTDPYLGTTTIPGDRIKKIEIEITIKNQKYPSDIMYNVRTKGHYEQKWTERFYVMPGVCPEQSQGQYTVIALPAGNYLDGSQVDIQVEAMSGTFSREPDGTTFGVPGGDGMKWVFDGVTSGWSKTRTLTIDKYSNEVSSGQSDDAGMSLGSDHQIGFSWIELCVITTVAVVVAVVVTLFILRKQLSQKIFDQMSTE